MVFRATTVNVRSSPHRPIMSDIRGELYQAALSGPVRTYHIKELGEDYMEKLEARMKNRPDTRQKGIDRDELLRLIIDDSVSISEAGRQLGISSATVVHHLKQAVASGRVQYLGGGQYAWRKDTAPAATKGDEPSTGEPIAPTVAAEEMPAPVDAHTPADGTSASGVTDISKLQEQINVLARAVTELWQRVEKLEERSNKDLLDVLNNMSERIERLETTVNRLDVSVERLEIGSDFADHIADIQRDLQRIEQQLKSASTTDRFLTIIERLISHSATGVIARAG